MVVLTVAVASTYGVTIAGPRKLRAASRVAAASSVVWASRDGGMLRHGAGTGMRPFWSKVADTEGAY